MKVTNRSAITINYKKPFVDWSNALTPELPMSEMMLGESTTYLIKEDFENADQCIKKYYKEIFELELDGQWTDENDWPQKLTFKLFNKWFSYEISDLVIDLKK
jgi:hypothetical protein